MGNAASAMARIAAKASKHEEWADQLFALRGHLEPLRELHLGRTKKERADWAKGLGRFVEAAKKADELRIRQEAKSLESHETEDGIDSASGAIIVEVIDGKPLSEIADTLGAIADADARKVRIRAYQFAVAFTNNTTPAAVTEKKAETSGDKKGARRCANRDRQFLLWHREKMGPAKIRDRWNREHPSEAVGNGDAGRDVVRKGIKAAIEDEKNNPES